MLLVVFSFQVEVILMKIGVDFFVLAGITCNAGLAVSMLPELDIVGGGVQVHLPGDTLS